MTYNVFGGTLSLTQSINQSIIMVHYAINSCTRNKRTNRAVSVRFSLGVQIFDWQ